MSHPPRLRLASSKIWIGESAMVGRHRWALVSSPRDTIWTNWRQLWRYAAKCIGIIVSEQRLSRYPAAVRETGDGNMSRDVCPIEQQSQKRRARVSNGSRLTIFGDGRSSGARRFRDVLEAFAAEAGGMSALSISGQQLVRRIAQVSIELELAEATRATGEAIDPVAYCALVNSQRRLLRDFEAVKDRSAKAPLTIAQRLAAGPQAVA